MVGKKWMMLRMRSPGPEAPYYICAKDPALEKMHVECEWNCMSKWKRKVYSNDPSFFQICIATVLVWVCCWSLLMGPISSLPCLQSILHIYCRSWGFPHSSVGKESAGNAGDPGSIPGSGRSAWEEWRKGTTSLVYKSKLFSSLIDILDHALQFRSPIFQTFLW